MNEDEGTELLRRRPERIEHGIVEIAAVDIGGDHGATQAKLRHRTSEFIGRRLRRLQRHGAKAEKAPGMSPDDRGDLLVLYSRAGLRQRHFVPIKERENIRRKNLNVHIIGVHIAQPQIQVPNLARERVLYDIAIDFERTAAHVLIFEHRRYLCLLYTSPSP